MAELSQADQFLLDGIRRGDADAWSRFVERYRGRLYAFANSRLRSVADAEDVLQDTFMKFLKALPRYRAEAGLETYLFTILRHRLVDWFRGRRLNICLLQDVVGRCGEDEPSEPLADVPSPDPSASYVAQHHEIDGLQRQALAGAIRGLVNGYKKSLKFRDLKIAEMLFYCQLPNPQVAKIAGVGDKHVSLIKHRCLKKVREKVAADARTRGVDLGEAPGSDRMLTEVWESLRISCPKRSTIGAYLLGSLEKEWHDYVDCHLHKLGCRFCLANLEDLKARTAEESSSAMRDRILQSTVGFLRRSYLGTQGNGRS